jgi:hypothetical protein
MRTVTAIAAVDQDQVGEGSADVDASHDAFPPLREYSRRMD